MCICGIQQIEIIMFRFYFMDAWTDLCIGKGPSPESSVRLTVLQHGCMKKISLNELWRVINERKFEK